MKLDSGLWHGVAFDAVLFASLVTLFWLKHRFEQAIRRPRLASKRSDGLSRRVKELASTTLLLTATGAGGFSKLGGNPELPAEKNWPSTSGRPLGFVAQLDLAEVQRSGSFDWLPKEGRIYAFVDPDGYGWAEQVQVIYSRDDPGPERPSSTAAFRARRVGFERYLSFPSAEWLNVDNQIDISFKEFESQLDTLGARPPDPGKNPQFRIGGYPDEIQGECLRMECEHLARGLLRYIQGVSPAPDIERASWEWRLLLQIDSDPALQMNWGDGGRLYVFIREQDAKMGDFSRTITLSQGY